jgi:hypothetical protein
MEECKLSPTGKEFRDNLLIAHTLSSVDRFCGEMFVNNGFGFLYREYQVEFTKGCKEAYKIVLDYIAKGDYASADIELSQIDEKPLNSRALAQVKLDLETSLKKLMKETISIANWLDGKIESEKDIISQIKELKENIDKIQIASNKHGITNLLHGETKRRLENFEKEINEVLTEIILKGLNTIEAFMDTDSFYEAEQSMEILSRVQRELAGYCTSNEMTEKSKALRDRLGSIVDNILTRYDFGDISKYPANPPKDILAKLKIVASRRGTRYEKAYNSLLGKIRDHFFQAIDNVRDIPLDGRDGKIRSLKYALHFLPEDLQGQFQIHIDELGKIISDEMSKYRIELNDLIKIGSETDRDIMKLGTFAQKCQEKRLNDYYNILREEVAKRLHTHRIKLENTLNSQDIQAMQAMIDIVKTINKYREFVGLYISEIEEIYTSVRDRMIRVFTSTCETLANISSIEHTSIVENAFMI